MKALHLMSLIALLPCTSAFSVPVLDTTKGAAIGQQFEAYPSPWQEADEESATPANTDSAFKSTTPSMTRAQRVADGHRGNGLIRFSKDLSKAYIDVKIELGSVPLTNINMFHLHCGVPGILGPILVDFALVKGSIEKVQQDISDDGILSVVIGDAAIVQNTASGAGSLTGVLSRGCIIPDPSLGSTTPLKVSTIAGMAALARQGGLYFNLHTTGQTYFGDIRGQLYPK
ncbi:MAG: hypothetical protein RL637_132 [Pseudomonadota bacterium]|jgi:hypothetical protein